MFIICRELKVTAFYDALIELCFHASCVPLPTNVTRSVVTSNQNGAVVCEWYVDVEANTIEVLRSCMDDTTSTSFRNIIYVFVMRWTISLRLSLYFCLDFNLCWEEPELGLLSHLRNVKITGSVWFRCIILVVKRKQYLSKNV